jgi:hypothetical protein
MTTGQNALLGKLRGAAALQAAPAVTPALELLTGSWDQPAGLFAPKTAPRRSSTHEGTGRKRTIYLDEQAEQDLAYLLHEMGRELGQVTRSEGVRRALRATRLATERRRSWNA